MPVKKADVVEGPKVIIMPALQRRRVTLRVVGTSPLVTNQFSEKAKRAMLEKMMGKSRPRGAPRDARDPQSDFEGSKYLNPEGQCCVRALSFKCAAVSAVEQMQGTLKKAFIQGSFHVIGELLPIQGGDPVWREVEHTVENETEWALARMREDAVTLWGAGGKTHDLRYRAEFYPWHIDVPVVFNEQSVNTETLILMFAHAGFSSGIGEYRPQKGGNWGMFDVTHISDEGRVEGLV